MRFHSGLFFLCALYSGSLYADPIEWADIPIENKIAAVGSIERISVPPGGSAEAGAKEILNVAPPPEGQTRWAIMPMKIGDSFLLISDARGKPLRRLRYQAISGLTWDLHENVKKLLSGIPGIHTEVVDRKIVILGKPKRAEDKEKVLQVQAAYVDSILNLAVDSQRLCETRICRHQQPEEYVSVGEESIKQIPVADGCAPEDTICGAVKKATNEILKNNDRKNGDKKHR